MTPRSHVDVINHNNISCFIEFLPDQNPEAKSCQGDNTRVGRPRGLEVGSSLPHDRTDGFVKKFDCDEN